jgi:hypothetical protein
MFNKFNLCVAVDNIKEIQAVDDTLSSPAWFGIRIHYINTAGQPYTYSWPLDFISTGNDPEDIEKARYNRSVEITNICEYISEVWRSRRSILTI